MSASPGLIYQKIPAIMADVGPIAKDRKNPQQGYQFRGIDDVYNAMQPVLAKHGVFVVPEITKERREERTTKSGSVLTYCIMEVKHTIYASDGSYVTAVTAGEAMDSGDKASNKAMSAAMKYAMIEVFCIPTEGDNDTENHTHEVAPPRALKPKEAPPSGPPTATVQSTIAAKEWFERVWTPAVESQRYTAKAGSAVIKRKLAEAGIDRLSDAASQWRDNLLSLLNAGKLSAEFATTTNGAK
jgi:hypothetical protein